MKVSLHPTCMIVDVNLTRVPLGPASTKIGSMEPTVAPSGAENTRCTTTARVAKSSEHNAGKVHRRDSLAIHTYIHT